MIRLKVRSVYFLPFKYGSVSAALDMGSAVVEVKLLLAPPAGVLLGFDPVAPFVAILKILPKINQKVEEGKTEVRFVCLEEGADRHIRPASSNN